MDEATGRVLAIRYEQAGQLAAEGKLQEAIALYDSISGYPGADAQAAQLRYQLAEQLQQDGNLSAAA